jgi:DNA-binding MarR family transcriptional regulator
MYALNKILTTAASEKRLLHTTSRMEVSILLELYRVYPSPLMLKSLAAVCETSSKTINTHLSRLLRLELIESRVGLDARAKFYGLSKLGESRVRTYIKLHESND